MLKKLDISISKSINQITTRVTILTNLFKIITHTSSGKIYPIYTVMILFILPIYGLDIIKLGIIGFAFQVPVYFLSKNLVKRKRPYLDQDIRTMISPPDKYSFPSGHCASSTLLTLTINQYIPYLTIYFIIWTKIIEC